MKKFALSLAILTTTAILAQDIPVNFVDGFLGSQNTSKKIWLAQNYSSPITPRIFSGDDDHACLLTIFADTTKHRPWKNSSGWNSTTSHCGWFGVRCDSSGRVFRLDLTANDLSGPFPDFSCLLSLNESNVNMNSLKGPFHLIHPTLVVLNAANNKLSGPLPTFEAVGLAILNLGSNYLGGDLSSISTLPNLSEINMANNAFSGPLPDITLNPRLSDLELSDNNLVGPLEVLVGGLPCRDPLPLLKRVVLRRNSLIGALPQSFFDCLPQLTSFDINSNNLSGPLPVFTPRSITNLGLVNNEFSGVIPPSWNDTLQAARYVLLENNQLSGRIPDFFGDLPSLKHLTLSLNNFSGPLPQALGRSRSLRRLLIDDANLEGLLPADMFFGVTSLQVLSMMGNKLSGSLPRLPPYVQAIHLSSNRFTGPIPLSYGSLRNLSDLRLEGNNLTGGIPPSLAALPALQYLLLASNDLSGELPTQYSRALYSLSGSNNRFVGAVPAGLCNATNVLLSGNKLASLDFRPEEDCKVETLDLSLNQLLSVPPFWPRLRILRIGNNNLTNITNVFSKMTSAVHLELNNIFPREHSISFSSIFGELRNVRSLETLDLTGNRLQGTFRKALFKGVDLPKLRDLMLGGNNISGVVPSSLGTSLISLSSFNISGNRGLIGSLPSSFAALVSADVMGTGIVGNNYIAAPGSTQVKYQRMFCQTRFVPQGKTLPIVLADPPFHAYRYCTCLDNFFGSPPPESGGCLRCPFWGFCYMGAFVARYRLWPVCDANEDMSMEMCPYKQSCKDSWTTTTSLCPSTPAERSKIVCVEGYEGRLCTMCARNYYRSSYGCKICGGRLAIPWWVYFCFGTLFQLGLSAWIVHKGERSTRSGLLRTLVLHAQLYASLPKDSGGESDFLFNLGLEGSECAGFDPFWTPFLFAIFLPVIALAVGPLLALAVSYRGSDRATLKADASLGVLAVWLLLSFGSLRRSLAPLNPTGYGNDDGTKYLTAFMWRPYSTTDPSFALAILSACWIPLLTAFALFKAEGPSRVYLEAPYREGLQKWEAVQVTRRLVVAYLQGLSPYESKALPVGLTLTLTVSLAGHCWLRPFRSRLDNTAEALSLCILQGTFVVSHVAPDSQEARVLLQVVNGVFLVALGLTVVFKKGTAVVKKVSQRLSKGDEKGQPLLPYSQEM